MQVIADDNENPGLDFRRETPAWQQRWPADELEHVARCPACGGDERDTLHENLIDNVFFVAAGRWALYRCLHCSSAYLDPRPDEASIGKAYGVYYTHTANDSRSIPRRSRGMHGLKVALTNGYLNARYGTRREPASPLGVMMARLMPVHRQKRDAEFRYLPKPVHGQRLLDIGCGNGDFLVNARDAGWDVLGIDPDPVAIAVAAQRGLDVRQGSIDLLAAASECFDAITLSHVLEHLHDPGRFIQSVHRLLKPGGVVFIDTPNIQSRGARRWGTNWRGLETPRHLVLFSRTGLMGLLQTAGFKDIRSKRRTAVRKSIYLASLRMLSGKSPYTREPARLPLMLRLGLLWPSARVEDDEFLTVLAWKPKTG